jgi:hypothetical protein
LTTDLSVGLFYDAVTVMELCDGGLATVSELGGEAGAVEVARLRDVISLAGRAGWLSLSPGGVTLTERGRQLLTIQGVVPRLRRQLADFIRATDPPWVGLAPLGVQEVLTALGTDETQCLREAELLDPAISGAVEWWDEIASRTRVERDEHSLETGRAGERLSVVYETARTGRKPRWISFESNLAGYDVLSIVSRSDPQDLRIEVKASVESPRSAMAHITAGEWEIATAPGQHLFHFWVLDPPRILVVDWQELLAHIPVNNGAGKWTEILIPFSVFDESRWVSP